MVGSKWRTWGNMTGALGWSSGYMLLPVIVYLIPDMKQLEGRNFFEFRCSEGENMKNPISTGKLFNFCFKLVFFTQR